MNDKVAKDLTKALTENTRATTEMTKALYAAAGVEINPPGARSFDRGDLGDPQRFHGKGRDNTEGLVENQ